MTIQTRHIELGVDVTSFQHNERFQGLFPAGRYRGFDTVEYDGSDAHIGHGINPYTKISNGGDVITDMGLVVTPQGVIIQCEGSQVVTLATNVGNMSIRYDALIMRHQYDTGLAGGSEAEFLIAPDIDPTTFVVEQPYSDALIGFFTISANSTIGASTCVYEPANTPGLGAEEYARLHFVNRYVQQQQFNQGSGFDITSQTLDGGTRQVGEFTNDGNCYRLNTNRSYLQLLPMLPVGTTLALSFQYAITLRDAATLGLGADVPVDGGGVEFADFTTAPAGYAAGFCGLELATLLNANYTLLPDSIIFLQMIDKGGSFGKRWKLVASSAIITQVGVLTASVNSLNTTVASHTTTLASHTASIGTMSTLLTSLLSSYEILLDTVTTLSSQMGGKASKTPEVTRVLGTITYPFAAGWATPTPYYTIPMSYRKNDLGQIVIEGGFMGNATAAAAGLVYTLPVGYRPTRDQYLMMIRVNELDGFSGTTHADFVMLKVTAADGTIILTGHNTIEAKEDKYFIPVAPLVFYTN